MNNQSFCCDGGDLQLVENLGPQSATDSAPALYFYHPDHLGSTAMVTYEDGHITQNVVYIPYGEVFVEERNGSWASPYLFNAKELDEETGLYYYGARYLDPAGARWLSVDPMWEDYRVLSPYSFCAGNPIRLENNGGKDLTIAGTNNSSVTFVTDLINLSVNAECLGFDFGGQYTLHGEDVLSAGLDIVGIIDPSGIADGVNATLQAKMGNWGGVALSAISILPFGDAAKVFKVGDDFKVISNAISVIQRNRIIGKMAESQITRKLAARFGKEAQIGEQITARFSDGTKIVFDNVVVKEGKIR